MWTHRRRPGVIAQASWPPAGNGLAGGAGATSGPLPPAADRPCSQPPGHIPRHHRAASRALRVPAGPPAAALDPGPGGTGRRPRRPPGRPAAGRPAASPPATTIPAESRIVTAPDAARRTVGTPPDLPTDHLRNRHANGDGQPTQAQKGTLLLLHFSHPVADIIHFVNYAVDETAHLTRLRAGRARPSSGQP
jgi:hypothetical protein